MMPSPQKSRELIKEDKEDDAEESSEEAGCGGGAGLFPCGCLPSQGSSWNEDARHVRFGKSVMVDDSVSVEEGPLPNNKVKTSKYTPLNFLCKNTYEQLQRMANVWFFILSFLMYVGYYHPWLFPGLINPWPTLGTLLMVMAVTAVTNALDDISRCRADKEMNEQRCFRGCNPQGGSGSWREARQWQELVVGDVLILENNEQVPADVVCLASAGNDGLCFVSTANLDGETNLKGKNAVEITQEAFCGKDPQLEKAIKNILNADGMVEAEPPGWDVSRFNGKITFKDMVKPLDADKVLLRGTVLRNTPWCVGLVIYTGEQTRMMKNSRPTPLKSPTLDKLINKAVLIIILIQAFMAVISMTMSQLHRAEFDTLWYLQPTKPMALPKFMGDWLTFFLLYSNLVPVSLFATIEVCNVFQAKFLNNDKLMHDSETNLPALVRSRNLCQETGQINYIFSDKTGTLTQNVMDLKQLSIAGVIYGTVDDKKGFNGGDDIKKAMSGKDKEAIDGFLEILGVAHTVIVDHKDNYEAESPDEAALVEAVAKLGYKLKDRQGHTMLVEVSDGNQTKVKSYTVLAVNAFTSARARMSVLVQRESGEYLVLCKGADSKMLERAKGDHKALVEHLHVFACEGLRTLALGRRKLSASEAQSLIKEYEAAHLAKDKDNALAAVSEKMEKDLEILGATAIEDKLQEGVGKTIESIRRAGIKLWVLTGDKLETARNIGFSCRVLTTSMNILVLESVESEDVLQELIAQAADDHEKKVTTAMMCTGSALKQIKEYEFETQFLELAEYCSVVIACRVAPLQKAEMVRMVSDGITCADGSAPITLAIGDGANDVPMIQEAKVGVGIYGKEGRQAVNNADFAIAQFSFLGRLLLIHGRWNYIRAAKVILFTFWRNAAMVLTMFYWTFTTGYTGVPLFEDMIRGSFNIVTFIPTVATGIMDRDFEAEVIMEAPELYVTGREGQLFNVKTILETMLSALMHSLVLLAIMRFSYEGMDMSSIGDVYAYGTVTFTCLIVAVSYRLILITEAWNWMFWLSVVVGCGCFYVVLIVGVTSIGKAVPIMAFPQMYMVAFNMVKTGIFWVCLFTVPALAMTMDLLKRYIWQVSPLTKDMHVEKALQAAKDSVTRKRASTFEGDSTAPKTAFRHGDATDTGHDFNHTGVHRHPSTLKRPSAAAMKDTGQTDITRNANSETSPHTANGSYSRVSGDPDEDGEPVAKPKTLENNFIQQEVPICWNCMGKNAPKPCTPCFCSATCTSLSGLMLIIFGNILLYTALSVQQVVIHYDGTATKSRFSEGISVHPGEETTAMCPINSTCKVSVQIPEDMQPPILVYYSMFPFYQNFGDYFNSIYWPELLGRDVLNENMYKNKCAKDVRENPEGERISPCGIQAKAFFNDSFKIEEVPWDETGIAWPSDVERFKNPPSYPEPLNTDWLYKRFPTIINQTGDQAGVKNEHFVTWVRPAAYAEVRNPYAKINQPLLKGQNLTIVIDNHYPVSQLSSKVRKELVLTTLTPFGGRDEKFAWFLIVTGVLCMLASVSICVVEGVVTKLPCCQTDDDDADSYYESEGDEISELPQ